MKSIFTNLFCFILITTPLSSTAQTLIQNWATLSLSSTPYDIATDASGYVYTTNIDNNTISKISPNGTVQTLATFSSGVTPVGIIIDAAGNIYTVNHNNTISKITTTGTFTETWAALASDAYCQADGIAIDAAGNLYTANYNNTVSKIMPDGTVIQAWATLAGGTQPVGIAIDADGNIFTTNNNNTISKITTGGTVTQVFATLAVTAFPHGLLIDAAGNIFTANSGNSTVSKITAGGIVTLAWATLVSESYPSGIAADASGNIYTANYNNTVSKITPDGTLTQAYVTLLSSDQNPLNAHPLNLAIDGWNNIFTANRYSNTVSKIITNVQSGSALNFDGINDCISIPHNALLKPSAGITIEAWIKPIIIHNSTYYEIYRKEDGNDRHLFSFQDNGNTLSFGLSVAGAYSELDVAIAVSDYENQWVHVAATFDGTTKKIYRNGVLIGFQNVSGTIGTSGTAPAFIGSYNGNSEFFLGNIDEFSLWNRALTQEEIKNNLNCEMNPASQSGLIALYHFNQGMEGQLNTGENVLVDASNNHLDGTLNNFSLNGHSSNWIAWGGVQTGLSCKVGINLCPGDNFNITSDVTGSQYQWQFRPQGTTYWISFSNSVSDYFSTTSATQTLSRNSIDSYWSGTQFRCSVDNTNYSSVYTLNFKSQWTGNASNLWSNAANWSCGMLPDPFTDVIINSGTVIVDVNSICNSIQIKPGVNLTLGSGFTLTVNH